MDHALRERREAAMAFRMIQGKPLAMRVAAAHMAGLFEAPPAMLKAYMSWAVPLYAGHVLAYADQRRTTLQDRTKPIQDAITATQKSLQTFEREMEALGDQGVAQWTIWAPNHQGVIVPQKIGIKYMYTNQMDDRMYLFDHSEKRLTFRKQKWPRPSSGAIRRVREILERALQNLQFFMVRTKEKSTDDGPSLVEMSLLVKEAKKYSSKAKSYKTSTKTTLPIDVTGWKYAAPLDIEYPNAVLAEKGWSNLNVVLVFQGHKSRGGVWIAGKRRLEVDVPFWGHPRDVAEFKRGLMEIGRIARHEFQHVGQDLLRVLTKGKEDRGLPSRHIRDPKRDPMGFPKTDKGRVVMDNRYREQHALQDAEFYTRLADEIGRFVAVAREIPLDQRRQAMLVWTASVPQKKMEFKGKKTTILRRKPFFEALVTRQKGKWQKAVGEFVAGVEKAGVKIPRSSASRVADMYLEARSSNEWLQWMVQPFDVIKKHHKKFIYGPLDDATDAIIKDIAPELVKSIVEQEVDEDVGEFLEGAQEGRFESLAGQLRDPESNTSEDYLAGYAWGYDNARRWAGRDLPSNVKKEVVQEQLREFRGEITEQVVIAALEKAWATVNPREMFMTVMRAVKQHGWKIGLVYALGEVIENLVIPAALTAITGVPVPPGSFAWLPLNDVVFAVIVKRLGGSSAVDDFEADGHLDWYESKFGPVRIACLQDK